MAQELTIGQCLKRIRRPVTIEDDVEYQLVTIKLKHGGVVERCRKVGKDIGTKRMYRVNPGDFILSGIDARNGAFGIVPDELDGAVVTNDFWYFDVNEEVISTDLFLALTQTNWFDHICRLGSDGTTQRIRLQKDKFFNQTITLPSIEKQPTILKRLQRFKDSGAVFTSEIEKQKKLLAKYRQAILQEAIEGKLTADWREQNPDVEPAADLLGRTAAEKAELVKQNKIRKQKPLPKIKPDEIPFDIPDSWEWCQLDEVIYQSPRNGYSPKTVDYPTGTKTLKLGATTSGVFIDTEIKYIDEVIPPDSHLWLEQRDILIQRGNSREFVGVSAVYDGPLNEFVYPDLMMKLQPVESVSEVFLHHALMSDYCREYFRDNAKGAQKSMPKINQTVVSCALVPMCSEAEQQEIVRRVEAKFALCDQLEAQINASAHTTATLSAAILQELFDHSSSAKASTFAETSADKPADKNGGGG